MQGGLRTKNLFNKTGGKANPLISIITVTYNAEKVLEPTIQSIISQTYPNIEYIIIDGNSKDHTLELVKKYDDKIAFWQSEKDRGIYDGMNKGLQAATGDYVWFMNAGDLIEAPDTVAQMLRTSSYEDVLYGETNLIDEAGKVLGTRSQLTTRKLPAQLTWQSLGMGMVVSHQSILIKKTVAPLYNLQYKCSADIDWTIRSLQKSQTVKNTGIVLSRFLTGGFSSLQQKSCLHERFQISISHFGIIKTLLFNVLILFRAVWFKITG
jgi:glycosyltransferase involved in cell wall biosynthesis